MNKKTAKPKRRKIKVGHIYACAFNYLGVRFAKDHSICGMWMYRVDALMYRAHWVMLEPVEAVRPFTKPRPHLRGSVGYDLDAFRDAIARGEMKRVCHG